MVLFLAIILRIIFIFHINQSFRVFKINHFFFYVEFVKISENFQEGVTNPTTSCATFDDEIHKNKNKK
jgi:hypothetical protein